MFVFGLKIMFLLIFLKVPQNKALWRRFVFGIISVKSCAVHSAFLYFLFKIKPFNADFVHILKIESIYFAFSELSLNLEDLNRIHRLNFRYKPSVFSFFTNPPQNTVPASSLSDHEIRRTKVSFP